MTDVAKRDLVAQWAFDTRPVLLRFHLWLEDVEVERAQAEPVSAHTFTPRGIARCLAMTSAATALGTRLFGEYGAGAGQDKATVNQVKKAADAVSAYVMSEGLWHLTRTLPEKPRAHGLPGRGSDAEGGRDAGDGRQSHARLRARVRTARAGADVDRRVRRCSTSPATPSSSSTSGCRARHHAVGRRRSDTLENTSRFADGQPTGRWQCSTSSMPRCGWLARTSRTWAASPCPPG
jgi:hypothetical protein